MTALRILHVDTGRGWRGGQAQVDLLAGALAARGHAQALAAPPGEPLPARVSARGVAATIPFAPRSDLDLPAALSLVAAAKRFAPDVVHLHDARAHATGWLAARAAGAACVVSRRVAFAGAGRRPHAWKYRALAADRWHAISRAVRDELVAAGVDPARVEVVPDALDVAATTHAVDAARRDGGARALREAWGSRDDGALWGTIAALTPEKGHADLLEALGRTRAVNARLVLVGDGPEDRRLRERAGRLGVAPRIAWAGRVEDVVPALAALDALVVPSRAEGFGSIVLLAQAAGVPVVATRVGGLVDAIDDGVTGRLVPPGDPSALAAALDELAADPAGARQRADAARAAVGRFDVATIAGRIESVYGKARGGAGQPDAAARV